MVTPEFEKWATGYAGCDGGDIGCENSPSIWVCGLEWGGGHTTESLMRSFQTDYSSPPAGYDDASDNLAWIFNWNTLKLLAAANGQSVANYKDFSKIEKPFVNGSKGYFKINLYPISFKNTSSELWKKQQFSELTGFLDKNQYMDWCRNVRFPIFQSRVESFKPRLIICFGKTYLSDFKKAFLKEDSKIEDEIILGKQISWCFREETLIAICPFPVNRNGLNSNILLQSFGDRIRNLLTIKNKG